VTTIATQAETATVTATVIATTAVTVTPPRGVVETVGAVTGGEVPVTTMGVADTMVAATAATAVTVTSGMDEGTTDMNAVLGIGMDAVFGGRVMCETMSGGTTAIGGQARLGWTAKWTPIAIPV